MTQLLYQVDAFTDNVFSGNPAAVCPLESWLDDQLMQKIAMENNLAETAFYVKQGEEFHIRWFTPSIEVDLCGHATLAAAFILFNYEGHSKTNITFNSNKSGKLTVSKAGNLYTLIFPSDEIQLIDLTEDIISSFDIRPKFAYKGRTDIMLVFENENEIKRIYPNFSNIARLPGRGVIITAKGNNIDFVSRFFAPQVGVDEDPVTGSAHTSLIPYWSKVLNKTTLTAVQLSQRRGYLECEYLQDTVKISGKAKLYLKGEIHFK